jgi:VWFA-related protein
MKIQITNALNRVLILSIILLLAISVSAQKDDKNTVNDEVTILVTVMPHNDRTRAISERLVPSDFDVLENKKSQRIISAKRAGDAPVSLAVLIQDNLTNRVNNELKGIKELIRSLPDNSQVMTAYVSTGTLRVRQSFTTDKEEAADSLRILLSSDVATPFSPYLQLVDGIKAFDAQPKGNRRMILFISDGLDHTFGLRRSSPSYSIYLDRAILEAHRKQVSVYSIFAPSFGLTRYYRHAINYGQGSLLRLADQTGGEAFFSGSSFVTFHPYLKEYKELMKNQWLITFKSDGSEKNFRRIEVTTDFDLHLHYPAGYRVK